MASDALLNPQDTTPSIVDIDGEAPAISPDKQFIQFSLEIETTLLLSVLNLVEILTVPISQVVPIFQMPAWIAGVYNWRGEILWLVDLGHLAGFSPWYQQRNYFSKHTVIVVKGQSEAASSGSSEPVLGLLVNRVNDMTVCEPELIKPVTSLEIPETVSPFLNGYRSGTDGKPEWILNGEAVLRAMPGKH